MPSKPIDMHKMHDRGAEIPLLFCTATNYVRFNRERLAERESPSRIIEQGSETDMSLKSITGWFENWMRYRAAVRELSQLTDRELSDLGIQRTEIDLVARQSMGM